MRASSLMLLASAVLAACGGGTPPEEPAPEPAPAPAPPPAPAPVDDSAERERLEKERLAREVGPWSALHPATLPDHLYTFAGAHPDHGGRGVSTLLPSPGGVVLGVAQTLGARLSPGWGVLTGHLVFLAMLLLRPSGLFSTSRRLD